MFHGKPRYVRHLSGDGGPGKAFLPSILKPITGGRRANISSTGVPSSLDHNQVLL